MSKRNEFWRFDTSIATSTQTPTDWETYYVMRNVLRTDRFSFHQDPETVRKYPSLRRSHHHGERGGLQFQSEIYPAGWELKFYQDVVHVNPHGGKYDFDKLTLMPYLLRKRCLLELDRVGAALLAIGFSDTTKALSTNAYEFVLQRRAEWEKSHGKYAVEPHRYEATDRDGAELHDGDVRTCRGPSGHLIQGNVFYNANSMWWVVPNASERYVVNAGCLFTYVPGATPRKLCARSKARRTAALEDAIRRRDFERAAALRDASGLTVEPRRIRA